MGPKKHLEELAGIVANDLCHRCGSCAGICPTKVIEPDDDYYPSWRGREDRCTDCGLCVRVCSGREFSFPEHTRRMFKAEIDPRDEHGKYLQAFLGYTVDPAIRFASTSGGIATELPRWLLEQGRIAGAFAVKADARRPWRPEAFIARDPAELGAGMVSKYPVCSMNHLLGSVRAQEGPFLYTGLPCHIQGLRKMMEVNKGLESKVALTVGLFCHSSLDHQGMRDILAYYKIDDRQVRRVIYRFNKLPGYVRAETINGEWVNLPYPSLGFSRYRPNAKECLTFLFKFYSPMRCRMCLDASAEFADIAIGDPWIQGWQGVARLRQGYNFLFARTERGLEALRDLERAGRIVLEPFPEERARQHQLPMILKKRRRAFHNIERRKKRGIPAPEYGVTKTFGPVERLRIALHASSYWASGHPAWRTRIVRFLLSPTGRAIVGLSFFRRRVLQAVMERLKTALRGEPTS